MTCLTEPEFENELGDIFNQFAHDLQRKQQLEKEYVQVTTSLYATQSLLLRKLQPK